MDQILIEMRGHHFFCKTHRVRIHSCSSVKDGWYVITSHRVRAICLRDIQNSRLLSLPDSEVKVERSDNGKLSAQDEDLGSRP